MDTTQRNALCISNIFLMISIGLMTFLTESELKNSDEQTRKWYSDYLDLMEYKRNPNYGRAKCFHCLLSPERDDPIFIGINRLVAKGLE